jgi:hypothetical protein
MPWLCGRSTGAGSEKAIVLNRPARQSPPVSMMEDQPAYALAMRSTSLLSACAGRRITNPFRCGRRYSRPSLTLAHTAPMHSGFPPHIVPRQYAVECLQVLQRKIPERGPEQVTAPPNSKTTALDPAHYPPQQTLAILAEIRNNLNTNCSHYQMHKTQAGGACSVKYVSADKSCRRRIYCGCKAPFPGFMHQPMQHSFQFNVFCAAR